jgi:hypothetical protein
MAGVDNRQLLCIIKTSLLREVKHPSQRCKRLGLSRLRNENRQGALRQSMAYVIPSAAVMVSVSAGERKPVSLVANDLFDSV